MDIGTTTIAGIAGATADNIVTIAITLVQGNTAIDTTVLATMVGWVRGATTFL